MIIVAITFAVVSILAVVFFVYLFLSAMIQANNIFGNVKGKIK